MQTLNAIKKLELFAAGRQAKLVDDGHVISLSLDGYIFTCSRCGGKGTDGANRVDLFKVRKATDVDDFQSDYHGGSYFANLKQALSALDRWTADERGRKLACARCGKQRGEHSSSVLSCPLPGRDAAGLRFHTTDTYLLTKGA